MKRRVFLGVSLAVLAGAGQAGAGQAGAEVGLRPRRKPALAPLARLQAARLGRAELGFFAVDLGTGAVRDSHQPDLPLPPASTLKTVTALYALDRLGAAHRFQTRVIRVGDALVLAGGGDPVLDSDALAGLAAATARAVGDWRPARFLVWGGALPRMAEVAPGQAAHLAYNPAVSGMMLNFNRIHLGWRCADSCAFSLEARAARSSPRAYTVSAAARPGGGAFAHSLTGGVEQWQVPRAGLGKAGSRWLPVRQPELYAGDVFQTLCRAEGLALPAPEVSLQRPEGAMIAHHDSPALTEVLRGMLDHSTNLTAEAVGLAASGAGDLAGSAAAMARWVEGRGGRQAGGVSGADADLEAEGGVAASGLRFVDHSGLSGDNRITARGLAGLLARPEARQALRGLLKTDPLRDVLGTDARGDGRNGAARVAAKTGTLNFVSCLAGYAGQPEGAEVAFAILSADLGKREETAGQELPAGVLAWVKRSKEMQRDLVEDAVRDDEPGRDLPEI